MGVKIKEVGIFSELTESELKEVEPFLQAVDFKKKESIFSEGDAPNWLYVVLDGRVKITKISHQGKEIILEVIAPKDFFGGIAVVRGFPYPGNAVAMEDAKVLKISRTNLMKVLDRFPSVMNGIAMNIGDRMRGLQDNLKNIALERVESRIASLLAKLATKIGVKAGKGATLNMKLTKQDIAEMVGTTVETSIRTMSKFKKLGLVAEKDGLIVVTDLDKLNELCGASEIDLTD